MTIETRKMVRTVGPDVVCAVVSLIAALFAASAGNLLAMAITSAFFGSSIAFAISDWRYTRQIVVLEHRVERLEALYQDRSPKDG